MNHTAYLCIGGNLGDRKINLSSCCNLIEQQVGKIIKSSAIYETQAWGSNSNNKFLNQVIAIETKWDVKRLLQKLLNIEKKLGRTRKKDRNEDRIIDIDILFYDDLIFKTKHLELPHPRLHLRKFVLVPLNEIAPKLLYPGTHRTISQLLRSCKDDLKVTKWKTTNFIVVEGNIGSGKSTFAKSLSAKLNSTFLPEEFDDNPLLPLFYENPKKYAFPLEFSFLLSRHTQLLKTFKKNGMRVVSDYSIYKSLWFAKINLSKNDFLVFERQFLELTASLPKPDLIIFLHTSVQNLNKNIRKRGRVYEKGIDVKYLRSIEKAYTKGLTKLRNIKVVTIPVTKYHNGLNKELLTLIKKEVTDLF